MIIRTTKEQILALLKKHGNLTIMDLAKRIRNNGDGGKKTYSDVRTRQAHSFRC